MRSTSLFTLVSFGLAALALAVLVHVGPVVTAQAPPPTPAPTAPLYVGPTHGDCVTPAGGFGPCPYLVAPIPGAVRLTRTSAARVFFAEGLSHGIATTGSPGSEQGITVEHGINVFGSGVLPAQGVDVTAERDSVTIAAPAGFAIHAGSLSMPSTAQPCTLVNGQPQVVRCPVMPGVISQISFMAVPSGQPTVSPAPPMASATPMASPTPSLAPAAGRTETVPLAAGCNNVTLTWAPGTPLNTIAANVAPTGALVSNFRLDPSQGRFIGYSPTAPDFANDYRVVGVRLETVFICTNAAGTLTRPAA